MIDLDIAVASVKAAVADVGTSPYAGLRLIEAMRLLRKGLEDQPAEDINNHDTIGYRNLLVAVVRRAIEDWVLYRAKRDIASKRLAREAFQWIFVDHNQEHDFMSFGSICRVLGADPDYMRRGIERVDPRQLMGRPAESRRFSMMETSSALLPRASFDVDTHEASED